VLRIVEWPSPQSSVQMTGKVPVLVGVMVRSLTWPGTASCFWPKFGTQNEWITSAAVISSLTGRSIGRRRIGEVLPFWYVNVQENCRPSTCTTSGFEPALPFWARTIALATEIAVTRTAGMTVQMISMVVFPWTGGPSDQSPGFARKLIIEYTRIAATTAKITRQMTVANQ